MADESCDRVGRFFVVKNDLTYRDQGGKCIAYNRKTQPLEKSMGTCGKFERERFDEGLQFCRLSNGTSGILGRRFFSWIRQ